MGDEEEPKDKEYRWETDFEKTWEAIKEADDGLIVNSIDEIIQKAKRKRQALKDGQRKLGMLRHVYVLLDCSEAMSVPDLKPTRLLCTVKLLEMFVSEFFDQNPISQLGLIKLKDKRADKICDLNGNSRQILDCVRDLTKLSLSGEPSLQNGLDIALKALKISPSYASREIIIIIGNFTICDPGDINETIDELKREGVRCSVVSLAAETRICRFLTQETGGIYSAILDDTHYKDQLFQHIEPLPAAQTQDNLLIKMGFPHGQSIEAKDPTMAMCMCHVNRKDEPSKLTTNGYFCPQCNSKYCSLPIECMSCSLMLVSAPHLTRSYHHLFPVHRFNEVPNEKQTELCYSCQIVFADSDKHLYQCDKCMKYFCIGCDIFIHDVLHICVGCTTVPTNSSTINATNNNNNNNNIINRKIIN